MKSNGPATYGGDGASIEDACLVFNYATELFDELGCPVVIRPTRVDGEPTMYVSGYKGTGEFIKLINEGTGRERACCHVLLLERAEVEAQELGVQG